MGLHSHGLKTEEEINTIPISTQQSVNVIVAYGGGVQRGDHCGDIVAQCSNSLRLWIFATSE